MNAITTTGSGSLVPHDMGTAMQLANMMSQGKLVPAHLQKSPGDCLMVIEQAMRWGMSPFAVAQSTSVIQGKLMFEGKLVAAALHASGILAGRLDYQFAGEGDGRAVTASGTLRGEDKPRAISVTLKEAKTNNGMWTKQPDQQLVYFATRAWARRHAPEVMLGVYSPEEFDAPKTDAPAFTGTTIDAQPEEPAAVQKAEPTAPKRTMAMLIDELEIEFAKAETRQDVLGVSNSARGSYAKDKATNGARERLLGIIDAAMKRTEPMQDEDAELAGGLRWEAEQLPDDHEKLVAFAAQHAPLLNRWKKERPELFKSIDDVLAEREYGLGGEPA